MTTEIEKKLDLVLTTVNHVSARLDSLDEKFSKFNERVSIIESKIQQQDEKLEELHRSKANSDSVKSTNEQFTEEILALQSQLNHISQLLASQQQSAKTASLKNELYSKRYNLIFHGFDENKGLGIEK